MSQVGDISRQDNSDAVQQNDIGPVITVKQMIIVGSVVLVIGALLFVLLNLYIQPDKSQAKRDLIEALGFILAGLGALLGFYATLRSLGQTRDSNRATLRLTQEGQITDRFTRAIDQLGATVGEGESKEKNLEIRLGGIYALEQIARTSERDFYWPIIEVLTAYVRRHAPSRQEGADRYLDRYFHDYEDFKPYLPEWEDYKPNLPEEKKSKEYSPDVRAIITVLRERARSYENGESEHLALQETNLSGAYLQKANLSGAYLRGANLSRAYLQEANLRAAWLWGANLQEANLSDADLRETKGITHDQLESAMGSEETRLPEGTGRPEWWSHSIEQQKNIIRQRLSG
jgi:hypothetical protein